MTKRRKTIVYVGNFEMPDKNAAAHRVLNNAKLFHSLGYHVVFCGIDKETSQKAGESYTQIETFDNFPAPYPHSQKQWIQAMLNFKHVRNVLDSYPNTVIVIAYNMHALPLLNLMRYCRQHNISIVADATEWYDNYFSVKPIQFLKFLDTTISVRVLQKHLDGIIAISSYLAEYYQKWVKNVILMPPLVDIHDSKWTPVNRSNSDRIEFVYSGIPGRTKDNLNQIIECLYTLGQGKKYYFTILGLTKKEFIEAYPTLQEQIKTLEDNVQFCGRVSHSKSITALKRADYCIFFRDRSRKNMAGFPTKFVESYTSGIHIITNNFSDIRMYFPDDENSILLENNDDASIMNALETVLSKDVQTTRKAYRDGLRNNPFYFGEWMDRVKFFLDGIQTEQK